MSQTKIVVLLSFKGHRQNTGIMQTESKEANATGAPLKKLKRKDPRSGLFLFLGCPPRCWCSSGPYRLLMGDLSVSDDASSRAAVRGPSFPRKTTPLLGAHVGELATPLLYGKRPSLKHRNNGSIQHRRFQQRNRGGIKIDKHIFSGAFLS